MPFFDDKLVWKGSSRLFDPDFAVFVLIQPVLSLATPYILASSPEKLDW